MLQFSEIFDISVTLGREAPVYPGDPAYERTPLSYPAGEATVQLSRLELCAHSGTHLDLPSHFFPEALTLENYPVINFFRPARVVQIKDRRAVSREALEELNLENGRALLFKTRNSVSGLVTSGVFSEDYVYLAPETAAFCVEKQAGLVGLDYYSIDRYGDNGYPAHRLLLKNGLLILEGLNLREVPEGEYMLICLPLKLKGAEASPVRAVLAR